MADVGAGPRSECPAVSAAVPAQADGSPTVDTLSLLAAAFQVSPAGLAIVDGPELRYRVVNDLYRRLCPDPEAEFVGQRLVDRSPFVKEPLAELAGRVLAEGGYREGETEGAGPLDRRWFAYMVHRIEAPGTSALLVTCRENTPLVQARRAAEAAAEAASRRAAELEAIMEAIPDGLMVFDAAGNVVRMNAAASESLRVSGLDGSEPAATVFARSELRGEDGRPLPQREWPMVRALRGERVQGMHMYLARAGARPVWMMASAAPILDAAGVVHGAVLQSSDETAMHELAEARDDLVRMVSHDLRTPLSAIYAQAHLIRRGGDLPGKAAERAAAIERSCERMSGMIQDLVEVTLLEAGQLPVSPSAVDVGALVPDILQGMRGGLDVDRVRLEAAGPCAADVDPARLERIVVNLVSNALKYSSHEVGIAVRAEAGAVRISVSDNGVGISPEDQARIFQRYYRAQGDRRPEGLGLGLYITRLLAEGMGGRVEVESVLGKGSTFHVILPAAAAEASPPNP